VLGETLTQFVTDARDVETRLIDELEGDRLALVPASSSESSEATSSEVYCQRRWSVVVSSRSSVIGKTISSVIKGSPHVTGVGFAQLVELVSSRVRIDRSRRTAGGGRRAVGSLPGQA
jgi:hypothetical protein